MTVLGSDTSFWQTRRDVTPNVYPDWKQMARTGIKYSIHRAGQGLWKDTSFEHDFKAAKAAGIPRGSYWFYDSRFDPNRQADLWLAIMGNDLGELPMWCDFEDNYGGAWHGWKNWYTFMARLQKYIPQKELGVYTAFYYWKENTLGVNIPNESLEWFGQFPLWIAQYKTDKPDMPKPFMRWTFWQYTAEGDGKYHGVQSEELDLNYFNGNEVEFRKRFNLSGGRSGMTIRLGAK